MGDYKTYKELDVWKSSRLLANSIYEITKGFPKEELYGIVSQMRHSSVSIPSSIAEGCGRQHVKESIQFFYIARSSLYELDTQLYLSSDQSFISAEELERGISKVETCRRLLNGFIN